MTILDGSSQYTRFRVDRGGQLRISACEYRCPARYRLRIEIQTPRAPDLAVSGGGILRAEGRFAPTPSFSAAVDGGGQVDARAIIAGDVTAAVNGGGRVAVNPRRRLTAAVNGGGEIRYLGNPQVMRAVNGGGAIRPGT